MDQYIKQVDDIVNNALEPFVKRPTLVRGIVHLLLMLYVARIAPSLPKEVLVLFDNQYFKLLVFALVLWTAQFSPSTSLLIAIGFMVSVNYATERPLWEFLENTEEDVPMLSEGEGDLGSEEDLGADLGSEEDLGADLGSEEDGDLESEEDAGLLEDIVSPPVAPTAEVAIEASNTLFQNQQTDTPVVTNLAQPTETVVIQPSIVQTTEGPTVVQPSVVVAPAVVTTPEGQQVLVQPKLTVLQAPAAGAPASIEGEIQPSAAPESGCYPLRRYDMALVGGYTGDDFGEFKQ